MWRETCETYSLFGLGEIPLEWQSLQEDGQDLIQRNSCRVLENHPRDGSDSVVASVLLSRSISGTVEQRVKRAEDGEVLSGEVGLGVTD